MSKKIIANKKSNKSKVINNIKCLIGNDVSLSAKTLQGKEYVVASVVMFVEGVHNGSGGPVYYPASELEASVPFWNGVPVTMYHPKINDEYVSANSPEVIEVFAIGTIFNTVWEDGKLKAEAWIDINLVSEKFPDFLETLLSGDAQIDVSTGVYSDYDEVSGIWNNEAYDFTVSNFTGDHLALLPGEEGACNWADGCGIRANKSGKVTLNNSKKDNYKYLVNENSFSDISKMIRIHLNSLDSNNIWNYLMETYQNYFIYAKESNENNNYVVTLYKQSYVMTKETLMLVGDAAVVTEERNYIEVNLNKGEDEMADKACCPKRVDALIKSSDNSWTKNDKEFLLGCSETELEKIIDNASPETIKVEVNKKHDSLESYLEDAPEEFKDLIGNGIKMHNEKKDALVKDLDANENCEFTKDDLDKMSINELGKLKKLSKNATKVNDTNENDYSGNGGNTNENLLDNGEKDEKPLSSNAYKWGDKKS